MSPEEPEDGLASGFNRGVRLFEAPVLVSPLLFIAYPQYAAAAILGGLAVAVVFVRPDLIAEYYTEVIEGLSVIQMPEIAWGEVVFYTVWIVASLAIAAVLVYWRVKRGVDTEEVFPSLGEKDG